VNAAAPRCSGLDRPIGSYAGFSIEAMVRAPAQPFQPGAGVLTLMDPHIAATAAPRGALLCRLRGGRKLKEVPLDLIAIPGLSCGTRHIPRRAMAVALWNQIDKAAAETIRADETRLSRRKTIWAYQDSLPNRRSMRQGAGIA